MNARPSKTTASTRRPLASTTEVAEYLAIPARTLDEWAHRGTGPAYRRVGKYRRYRWEDVDRWLATRPRGGSAGIPAIQAAALRDAADAFESLDITDFAAPTPLGEWLRNRADQTERGAL